MLYGRSGACQGPSRNRTIRVDRYRRDGVANHTTTSPPPQIGAGGLVLPTNESTAVGSHQTFGLDKQISLAPGGLNDDANVGVQTPAFTFSR
jgi:hypothetical protein